MNDSVEDILSRLLHEQETLDQEIFNYREEMIPEIRQELLKRAKIVIKEVFAPIKGLEVYDICLTGSAAGYFYHEGSDIDIRIEIHNKNCSFVSKKTKSFDAFLNALSNGYHRRGYVEMLGKRLVDIKTSSRQIDVMGLYSILHDKWRIYPYRNLSSKISKDEIMDMYNLRKSKIEQDVKDLKNQYKGLELADRLNDYYVDQVVMNTKVKDYLVYKLLVKSKFLQSVGGDGILEYVKAGSLAKEELNKYLSELN